MSRLISFARRPEAALISAATTVIAETKFGTGAAEEYVRLSRVNHQNAYMVTMQVKPGNPVLVATFRCENFTDAERAAGVFEEWWKALGMSWMGR